MTGLNIVVSCCSPFNTSSSVQVPKPEGAQAQEARVVPVELAASLET